MSSFRIQTLEHAVSQPSVEGFYNTPPTHVAGLRVIVGPSPTGDFTGHANKIAWSNGTSWFFDEPEAGWNAWVNSEDIRYIYDGVSWENLDTHDRLHSLVSPDDHKTEVEHAGKVAGWDIDGKVDAKLVKELEKQRLLKTPLLP